MLQQTPAKQDLDSIKKNTEREKKHIKHATFQELSVLSVSCFALLFQRREHVSLRILEMLCERVVWKHTEDVGTLELKELHVARPAVPRTGLKDLPEVAKEVATDKSSDFEASLVQIIYPEWT
jgi:hypothetical protein